jgi:hypothetical protein
MAKTAPTLQRDQSFTAFQEVEACLCFKPGRRLPDDRVDFAASASADGIS